MGEIFFLVLCSKVRFGAKCGRNLGLEDLATLGFSIYSCCTVGQIRQGVGRGVRLVSRPIPRSCLPAYFSASSNNRRPCVLRFFRLLLYDGDRKRLAKAALPNKYRCECNVNGKEASSPHLNAKREEEKASFHFHSTRERPTNKNKEAEEPPATATARSRGSTATTTTT